MKYIKSISKGELKKYNNHYCNLTLPSGEVINGGKIFIGENGDINFVSFSSNADGGGEKLPPFKYSYILYSYFENDSQIDNDAFESIEIED